MSIAIRSLVDLSTHCAVGLHHDCRDPACEDYCHDEPGDELAPLWDDHDEAMSWLDNDTRQRRAAA